LHFVDSHDFSRIQLAEVSATNSSTDDVGMRSIAAPGNMDVDDQPLATWIGEKLQCPPSAKESSKLV
jgi:hypothetical protein